MKFSRSFVAVKFHHDILQHLVILCKRSARTLSSNASIVMKIDSSDFFLESWVVRGGLSPGGAIRFAFFSESSRENI